MDHKKQNNSDIVFHLAELMTELGMSKNRLCVEGGLRFETVQGFYLGNISRVDLYVLSQMCRVLDCQVSDILEYIPKKS